MKNFTKLAILGLAACTVLFVSAGLSEPYKVEKGDTLTGIATAHKVTVKQLKAANHFTNSTILRVGQVIIIPEPPSSIGAPVSPSDASQNSPASPHETAQQAARESAEISALRKHLDAGWIVTENSSTGKIFVHESVSGGSLIGLRYLIKESNNQNGTTTWTVYRPAPRGDGTNGYGRIVGVMDRPGSVDVSSCNCE